MNTLPERTIQHKANNEPPTIPGGVYMIPPLATVSLLAAFVMKLITWRELCTWIALWEVRTWRDTGEPGQRNIFRFSPRRVAQALGRKRAGSKIKHSLAKLQQLGLAHLSPTDISFTDSLDALPYDLREETQRILKVLGNDNYSRALRMPRRLMRHVLKSPRPRPVRAAVIQAMLLRIMMAKRDGWYKGCLTSALLADVTRFNESRIKHERAALVREGYFDRLETPARVRRQQGDWYALGHDIPISSILQKGRERQPQVPQKRPDRQPPIKKPVPSVGIERNQFLSPKPGASRSTSNPDPTAAPSWHHIRPEDLGDPRRRAALHKAACQKGVINGSPAQRLTFYAAIARARRLSAINPCGMLRRIVETTAYHGYIADCDEDQARAWLRELEPQPAQEVLELLTPKAAVDFRPSDVQVYRILAHGLLGDGYDPTKREAYDVLRRIDNGNVLKRWTRERWEAARAEALGWHLSHRNASSRPKWTRKPLTGYPGMAG